MEDNIECLICGKQCLHLGSHIWHAHKMLAKDYKTKFGLDYKYPLISESVSKKKKEAVKNNPSWQENFKKGKEYRFKKGEKKRKYFSEQSKERNRLQSKKLLKVRVLCPVCNMQFNNIHSHLREKHQLKLLT